MSNPLRWFRKYEKILLGVFGVALMIVFTFSLGVGSIEDLFFGGPSGPNPTDRSAVVATWDRGDLHESDFEQLRAARSVLMGYQQNLFLQAQARGSTGPQASPIPFDTSDEPLLQLAVLSEKAEQLGIEISDESILNYLVRFTGGKLKPTEFATLWRNTTGYSDQQLLSLLRRELLAMQVRGMMQSGAYPASMVRKWEFYNRLEREINAEVMPIAVDDFIAKVTEPTEAEVAAFYEQNKSQYAIPGDPEPGFRLREQASFGVVALDFEKFLDAEVDLISDSDIQKYYDENKDSFRELSFLEDDLTLKDLSVPDPDADPDDAAENNRDSDNAESDGQADQPDEASSDEAPTPTPSPRPQESSEPPASEGGKDQEEAAAKYKPLEKVEAEIRRTLARPAAQAKFERALSAVQGRMKDYYRDQVRFNLDKQKGADDQPPAEPDLSDIEGPQLTIESIPLSDVLSIANYDIGKAFDMAPDGSRFVMFGEVAFDKGQRPLYSPQQFPKSEAAKTTYVYWMKEYREAYTPKLAEVREQVIAAWKRDQAVALAEKAAEEAVHKATKANKPLAESLSDMSKEFFETGMVSWLSGGDIPYDQQSVARATELVGIESPGYELYHTLFSLDVDEVGYAANESKSMIYVFRVFEVSPDLEVLQEGFVQNANALQTLSDMREFENRRTLGEVYREMLDKSGIEWQRDPEGGS